MQMEEKLKEAVQLEQAKEEDLKKELQTTLKPPPVWSSGLCSCCAKPGGAGLCMKSFCCPCLITGKINGYLKLNEAGPCPGGCFGGCCLGCCCTPCYMCKVAPKIAKMNNRVEGGCKACMCGTCCPCCYIRQVYHETMVMTPAEAPLQETMGDSGAAAAPAGDPAKKWSTGLCKCCAKPGGCGLCCKTCVCPCLQTGALNAYLKSQDPPAHVCPGGKCGGCCLGCCCFPCFMRSAGPAIASMAGMQQGKCKACMCGLCCPTCYLCQVFREHLILTTGEAPA